jgi:hypothetical protein
MSSKTLKINTSAVDEDAGDSDSMRDEKKQADNKAVDRAKAAVDSNFRPPASVWNSASANALMQQVDGPSLDTYESKDSIYVARAVPLAAGAKMDVPIHVTAPGSVVEYAVELAAYDIVFSVSAERDDSTTIVREPATVDCASCPITQKFLVGAVPCLIQFHFDNGYSWLREKHVSYKITVTPPSREALAAGRRRRAQACLKAVHEDLQTASTRLQAASQQKAQLQDEVANLMAMLQEKKKAWVIAEKEEAWLKERKALRLEQERLLKERITKGWPDEKKK